MRWLCCGNINEGRDGRYDNTLLDPDGGRFYDTSEPRNTSFSSISEDNEGATLQIIETIGQLEDMSVPSLVNTLGACMDLIPSQHVRLYILNHLLEVLPSKKNKIITLRALLNMLDDKQRKEVSNIVTGLPPSVFGDSIAREQTRVLVDLVTDAKECAQIDKMRVASQKKFVEAIIEMFQQTLISLNSPEQTNVVIAILQKQLPSMQVKITLKQLVASRCMQADYASREDLMRQLFPSPESSSSSSSLSLSGHLNTSTDGLHATSTTTSSRNVNTQPHLIDEL